MPTILLPIPAACNACSATFGNVIYDARIPRVGSWGHLCPSCFESFGCSLGTGKGQKYELSETGHYTKTKG